MNILDFLIISGFGTFCCLVNDFTFTLLYIWGHKNTTILGTW